jgi:ABC-type branched-subunit amino acid transport system ATPase component
MLARSSSEADGIRTENLCLDYAGVRALDDVTVRFPGGKCTGLIGPNGAGKTTLVNVLTGFARPDRGRVLFFGADTGRWSPEQRARRGLARTFQNARIFPGLSVFENVEVAALCGGLNRRAARREADRILALSDLRQFHDLPARQLPYAHQRILGMARALGLRPRFLFLDEPAAGIDDLELPEFIRLLGTIREDSGCGVILIEHNVDLVFQMSDHVVVLDHGAVIAQGEPAEIRRHPDVMAAYLGTEASP